MYLGWCHFKSKIKKAFEKQSDLRGDAKYIGTHHPRTNSIKIETNLP
jgi:hypothetical protein